MSVTISAIIPVFDSSLQLRSCLQRLKQSTIKPLECIVADDGSTDGSREIAMQFGAKIIATEGRFGPARARNLGARAATGDILFFIDADVCVHPDTVARVEAAFSSEPELDALIGSYDDAPEAPDFLSQYRNLLHAFTHQTSREEACTFWSGCGAIRRQTFLDFGGFDESYNRPAIEDIEFGARLVRGGRKIKLHKEVQVKHLKRWSFSNILKTDIFDRGIPWTELILREGRMPNDLNLRISQRVSVGLAFLLLLVTALEAAFARVVFIAPALALLAFVLGRYWADRHSFSWATMWRVMLLLAAIAALSYSDGLAVLVAPVAIGYALLLSREALARKRYRLRRWTGSIYALYATATICYLAHFIPLNILSLSDVVILLLLALLNVNFYLFLSRHWGVLCTMAAIPIHLLYFFCNGFSFLVGVALYGGRAVFVRPTAYRLRL